MPTRQGDVGVLQHPIAQQLHQAVSADELSATFCGCGRRMIRIGTVINAVAVLAGGGLGMLVGAKLPKAFAGRRCRPSAS